jgi:hypothetical protein
MSTILCRICWMKKYNQYKYKDDKLKCVGMKMPDDEYGQERWNFSPCEDGIIRGYVMLTSRNKDGDYTGTINIDKLGAKTKDKFIDNINIIFFAENPKDKTNYIVGWYSGAKVYRTWKEYEVDYKDWGTRSYSFEVDMNNAYLIPTNKRNIRIITAKSKEEAIERGGSFPGQSSVFFCSFNNEEYVDEILEKLRFFKLENQKNISDTEKQQLISARIGQGWFRKKLINFWKGCAVTKCKEISMLRASHIKPWRDSNNEERLNVYNGLLLTPNLDALFDKGFISFDDNGQIIISEKISKEDLIKLGIYSDIKISVHRNHAPFLKWHRNHILK